MIKQCSKAVNNLYVVMTNEWTRGMNKEGEGIYTWGVNKDNKDSK